MSAKECPCLFDQLPLHIFETIATELVLAQYYDELMMLSTACSHWRFFLSSFRLAPGSLLLHSPDIPDDFDEGTFRPNDLHVTLPASPTFYQVALYHLHLDQTDWGDPDRAYFTFNFPDPILFPSAGYLKQWLFLDDPVLDARSLLCSYLRQENELIRSTVARFSPSSSASQPSSSLSSDDAETHQKEAPSGQSVYQWEVRSGITLPRVLRKLYQRIDGGVFNDEIEFFSLERILATRLRPIDVYTSDLDSYVIAKLSAKYKDEELQAHIEEYRALPLRERPQYGISKNLSMISIGLPSRSTAEMRALAEHPEQGRLVNGYVQFAYAKSGVVYCDVNIRFFFNSFSHQLPIHLRRLRSVGCKNTLLASENHLSVMWDHEDPSGNGGWWNKSFAKLPESFTTWLIILLQDLGHALGAYDQP